MTTAKHLQQMTSIHFEEILTHDTKQNKSKDNNFKHFQI